ncbi:hypothetical protein [Opitutus sp. GAS368]|jgi:hypothetical protein|uniref:hypothetical protein n=1 Tax=Opitutus sp. GAS368 TaxID=1882749 RepID=UPI00087D8FAB|nr:hypothetical protein [Opitutus sp. GAS368]SDR71997.1 hypothetical protein SAMN05444173_0586 [Opitutus sp. GAS368]
MKTAGLHLLAFVVTGTLAAQEPVPAAPVKTSLRLQAEIRASLPPFTPPPPKVLDQPHDSGIETDPDLFALPKFTVKEKRPPGHDPDLWQTERAIQRKAMLAYQDTMTPLEWALNSWFIPILSAPASVRARAAYHENKIASQVSLMTHVAGIHQLLDAKNPDLLKKAVTDMGQADDWQSRPAGAGRAK